MKYCLPLLMLLASVNCHAGLYKWVDADGKVHYTDKQPPADASKEEELRIRTSPDQAQSAPPATKSYIEQAADLKKAQKAKEEADKKVAQQEEVTQTKKKNCAVSRNNLQTLQNSPRITSFNAQGQPVEMDESARQQGIAEAQKNIAEFCN